MTTYIQSYNSIFRIDGFYNVNKLNTHIKIKKFLKDAMLLSYQVTVESKHRIVNGDMKWREINKDSCVEDILNMILKVSDLKCIDRNIYNQGVISDCDGEVIIINTTNKSYWQLLYCHMNLNNLKKLVEKYKLKLYEY